MPQSIGGLMKNVILGLALVSMSAMSSAFACSPEAQFIGKVRYVSANCTYSIDFTFYNESRVCPLSIMDAEGARFEDKTCSLKEGELVSGYLVIKDNKIVIE